MATLIFVLFWVAVGIGLVVLGIRSGPSKKSTGASAARGRPLWYVGFALVVAVFGIVLPIAATFGRERSSRSLPASGITELTTRQEHGRELFFKYCSQCHTLEAANTVARVGPNLDTLRPTKGLVLDAIAKGRARGNGAMPPDLVSGEEAQDVADFVAAAVGQTGENEG